MPRLPKLEYHRGTLTLHPPPPGNQWQNLAVWDDRVEKYRIPGKDYGSLVEIMQQAGISFEDCARDYHQLDLNPSFSIQPYLHQQQALAAWVGKGKKGVVVLPTGTGKTYLAQMAMAATPWSTLILVPTLDLMHQWYQKLTTTFSGVEIGLLGGGSSDRTPILISTYHSAAIQAEFLGNRYGFLIFDECHHLPSGFFRSIAELSIAPYRLGLSATPERSDGEHQDLDWLIGPIAYRQTVEDLAQVALSPYQTVQIRVQLSQQEQKQYQEAIATRNQFLQQHRIPISTLPGWQKFVQLSARSREGRRAMLAHQTAKNLTAATEGKLRVLVEVIQRHYPDPILVFTNDNATVYRISQEFLIPALTHQTPVKERHAILQAFREGVYKVLVTSHVLNEGVDIPAVQVAVILSGSGSNREYIQRLGRILRQKSSQKPAILYEVIASETREEGVSQRRQQPLYFPPSASRFPRAAEPKKPWGKDNGQ